MMTTLNQIAAALRPVRPLSRRDEPENLRAALIYFG